jgi:hypothetical protein
VFLQWTVGEINTRDLAYNLNGAHKTTLLAMIDRNLVLF